ncbi:hypothetical protein MCOR25_001318 [Pyricularia grisea]|uniref:Methyltransferase OMS1 n=1 Tax=Pyricularia grisea TaxID=148305 RepID=A0A6P8BLA3_PYRGI|nr:uncharacterized protein PgNI_01560 [Pyricularia grisea]KAI6381016.1 hypothetical protein MCOR25_001318 [Pyricularia grisea]TLD17578.1 hypothetical protein PgNI_01560 [Pyricularia grisea]
MCAMRQKLPCSLSTVLGRPVALGSELRTGTGSGFLSYKSDFLSFFQRHIHQSRANSKKAQRPARPIVVTKTQDLPPALKHRAGKPKPSPSPEEPAKNEKQDKREPLPELFRKYRYPFVGSIVAGSLFMAYASYLITAFVQTSSSAACCSAHHTAAQDDYDETLRQTEPAQPTGLPPTISRATASEFDTGLDWPEWLMGVTKIRQSLAAECRGDVLEVAVGTGRNFKFYDWDDIADVDPNLRVVRRLEKRRDMKLARDQEVEMTSYTGVDVSADVLEIARTRIRTLVPGMKTLLRKGRTKEEEEAGNAQFREAGFEEFLNLQGDKLRLVRADVHNGLPLPPSLPVDSEASGPTRMEEPTRYDVIVQTFGLCSVSSPKRLLANMADVLKPETGRMLLLEHGRGNWGFVNNVLDKLAPSHFQRFGCWWNRDIERIVRDAASEVPGLEVVSIKRPGVLQAGTTLLIELRVRSDRAKDVPAAKPT